MKWGERVAWLLLGALIVGVIAWRTIAKRQEKLNQMYAADSVKSQAANIERVRLTEERDSSQAQYARLSAYAQASDARTAAAQAQLAQTKPLRAALDSALVASVTAGDSVAALQAIVHHADTVAQQQDAVIASQSGSLGIKAQQIASLEASQRLSDSTAASWKGEAERWRANADSARKIPTAGPGRHLLGFLPLPTCVAGLGVVAGPSVAAGTGIHTGLGGTAGVGILCGVKLGK